MERGRPSEVVNEERLQVERNAFADLSVERDWGDGNSEDIEL